MTPPISGFRKTFLSNMQPCIINYKGHQYISTESAYQANKTDVFELRNPFTMMNGYQAKDAGKRLQIRQDWEDIKLSLMEDLLRLKFVDTTYNPELQKMLLDTGDAELIETVYWHDNFWGNCTPCRRCDHIVGQNHLGKLLMKIRSELQEAAE